MDRMIIRAGRLIDGTGGEPLLDQIILIEDGILSCVEPWSEKFYFEHLSGAIPFDFSDQSILPGLIDTHLHLVFDAARGPVIDPQDSETELLARIIGNAQAALRAGVTTVCDVGGPNEQIFAVRDAIDNSVIEGPRILASGCVLTSPGGHGEGFGLICQGEDAARQAVRTQAEEGADLIKVMATGGGGEDPNESLFSLDELTAIVDEARRHNLRVAAHCHGTEGMRNCVAAGVDRIEHATFMTEAGSIFDPELADEMVARGIFVCPTNVIDYRQIEANGGSEAGFAPRSQLNVTWRAIVEHGIKVAASSDAGVTMIQHDDYALIPELMVRELGMTPMQAICACTQVAAEALGLDEELGTVETGKRAELVAVEGNPIEDIGCLRTPSLVIKGGRLLL